MVTASDPTNRGSPQSQNPRYTPNPWSYDEDDARIYYDDGDVQPTIAYVERDGVAPEQVKADGYLLACAPAMLAALRIFLSCRNPETGGWTITAGSAADRGQSNLRYAEQIARAAITKATGGVS